MAQSYTVLMYQRRAIRFANHDAPAGAPVITRYEDIECPASGNHVAVAQSAAISAAKPTAPIQCKLKIACTESGGSSGLDVRFDRAACDTRCSCMFSPARVHMWC